MPSQSYAIEKGGLKRLNLSWKYSFKDVSITFDGQPVGVISDQKALAAGQQFSLPDGSQISVKLKNSLVSAELQVLRNEQPLPGSPSDPQSRLKTAYSITYFIAGLNLLLGVLAMTIQSDFLQRLSYWPYSIAFGLIFLLLGFLVQRRSSVALILAIVIFALDGLVGIYLSMVNGSNPGVAGIIARVLLIIPMVQGVSAIKALKAEDETSVITPVV